MVMDTRSDAQKSADFKRSAARNAAREFALKQAEKAQRLQEEQEITPENVVLMMSAAMEEERKRENSRGLYNGLGDVYDQLTELLLPDVALPETEPMQDADVSRHEVKVDGMSFRRNTPSKREKPSADNPYGVPIPKEGSWRGKILAERARGERGGVPYPPV